ncbi:Hypothetical predicted protein [Scomber scombrus]|uniref:Uncharacterized protein n=1 Tax=Scomber scombrus TaxID=13677 RepID=A0AAV1QD31_SCOSC
MRSGSNVSTEQRGTACCFGGGGGGGGVVFSESRASVFGPSRFSLGCLFSRLLRRPAEDCGKRLRRSLDVWRPAAHSWQRCCSLSEDQPQTQQPDFCWKEKPPVQHEGGTDNISVC